jgi:hypothetical protein
MNGPTERQLAFLKSLVADRQDKVAQLPAESILKLKSAIQGELDGKTTSTIIDYFKRLPADIVREKPTPGFYVLDGDVYEVKENQAKTNVYAMQITEGGVKLARRQYVASAIHAIARKPDRLPDVEAAQYVAKSRTKPRPRVRVNA